MYWKEILDIYENFNPRSREGSDFDEIVDGMTHDISIHAPARGATVFLACVALDHNHFNPRSREGSDGQAVHNTVNKFAISIHAPARGATSSCSAYS